jgi:hypothetical protein
LRVIEISDRIAGSYCGKLLVDAGAQVRKIEPPQGDSLRRYSATCSPVGDRKTSPFFSYLNAGKRSLTIAQDSERYRAELAAADVVVVTAGRAPARPVFAAIPPGLPSLSAATWGSTWAVCMPRSARWPCAAASSTGAPASTSTCPCSRR